MRGDPLDPVGYELNPNCGVELNDTGACDFVARQPIPSGEEITFDRQSAESVV
jgi:hypothetical protein